jgi:hypothetical protein
MFRKSAVSHLVSSNSSYLVLSLITRYKAKLSEPMHLLFDILFYSRLKLCSIITFYSGSERVILHFNGMRKDYFGRAIKECLKILKENSDVVN